MFKSWLEKRKQRLDKIQEARENFVSWLEVSKSKGWKVFEERIAWKIHVIKEQIENNVNLSGEDLKRLQLALQVWKQVQRIPKELEDNAKSGGVKQ